MEFLVNKEDRNKSGIYMITNVVNGKFYIGSAKRFWKRHRTHIDAFKAKKQNAHFQQAWEKYGSDSFIFSLLEFCNLNILLKREQWYLDTFSPCNDNIGYNYNPTAGSNLGMRWTEEARERQSRILIEMRGIDYEFESPDGQIYKGRGVSEFAKKMKISASSLYHVNNNKSNHYKGWKKPGKKIGQIKENNFEFYRFLDFFGNLYCIPKRGLYRFAKQIGVHGNSLCAVWSGRLHAISSYQNSWTKYENNNFFIKLLSPNKKLIQIMDHNTDWFSRLNNIDPSSFRKLINKKVLSAGGWVLAERESEYYNFYKVIQPNGEILHLNKGKHDVFNKARELDLDPKSFYGVIGGSRKEYAGFKSLNYIPPHIKYKK